MRQHERGYGHAVLLSSLLLAAPLLLVACSGAGSPKSASGGGGATTTSTVARIPAAASTKALPLPQACQQLKGVLAAGPSAGSNPVGHAKDQLVPLTEVRTSDAALLGALRGLVSADHSLVAAHGHDADSTARIALENKTIALICAGASS